MVQLAPCASDVLTAQLPPPPTEKSPASVPASAICCRVTVPGP